MDSLSNTRSTVVPDWPGQRAHLSGDRLALVVGDRRWTYAGLDRLADRMARQLTALGVGAGDRVALILANGSEFVGLVHGLTRLGAILVPINRRLTPAEIEWQIGDAGAGLLIHDRQHVATAEAVTDGRPGRRRRLIASDEAIGEIGLTSVAESERIGRDRIDLGAVQSIIYTSGTTGHPKGALITYGNLWWSAVGSALNLGHRHDDRWLVCLPLFHIGGLSILFRSAIYGIAAIVQERFDPDAVNRAIDEDGVTIVSVVSTMLQRMLEARGDRAYPSTLRCVLLGGGPAPRPLLEACASRNVPVVQTYGLTEATSQVATLAPEDALRKLGSAGKPLLGTELRIARDGADAVPGEVGEIVVRGPTVSPGYVNPRDASAAWDDGWLRTGDLGYLDDEGFLYVVDRRVDLIVSGGENVYPAEVEAALLAHPAIEEAGVIGVPDPRWGQAVAAVIKLRGDAAPSVDEIRAFCRSRLAGYKVPTQLRFVDALPRNATGKLLRRELRGKLIDCSHA
ncbi:MAG: o-succinylbenzoate--CoA ligase [Chloroflexota bacterium]